MTDDLDAAPRMQAIAARAVEMCEPNKTYRGALTPSSDARKYAEQDE